MKTAINFGLILAMMACSNPNPQDEIPAIKAAIENETQSFYNVDKAAWDGAWVQAKHAYWSYSDSTGTSFVEGWDNISNNFADYFKTQKANRNIDVVKAGSDLTIDRVWQEVRVYGDGAYVRYTQKVRDKEIDRDETSQIRVLEKKDGRWLIAYVGIIAKYPN